jgi:alpha-mannosidase
MDPSMLKHPDITRRRLDTFYSMELESAIILGKVPLSVEFCEVPHHSQAEAKKGPWKKVERGFRYGPAYQTFWFRVTGEIPPSMRSGHVVIIPSVGGERTAWRDNCPYSGIDGMHWHMDWPGDWGHDVELYVEAVSRNPQCRIHGKEPVRELQVETMEGADLALVDDEIKAFAYDFDFGRNLLDGIAANDPDYAILMRGLNSAINAFSPERRESIGAARKCVRDAMDSLSGEYSHTITPVGHAHLDTAWLWPIAVTKKKMAHTTSTQLMLMDRYPEYVFVHSQASQYEWLEKEYPELFEKVKAAIQRGQWEPVGSMWVEADCNLSGGESLVRQFLYGRRYFRDKLGYETTDMWLPDVFGYSAAIPQILSKFGIRYFLTQKMSWNQFNKFPHNTFWWQGIDGSKVWAHFPPADNYGSLCEPKEIIQSVQNHKDQGRSDHSLFIYGYGDGGGGPTERHLEFLRRARVTAHLPEIQSRKKALDFFRDARARSRDLATWFGELYLEMHRGTYTTQAANKKGNRYGEFLLRDAEYLACFSEDFPKAYPAAELERLWKLVLLNQFHDIIPGSSVNEVYRDSDSDYAEIMSAGGEIVASSLKKIGSKFNTSQMSRPVALFQNAVIPSQGSLDWPDSEPPTVLACADEVLPVQLIEEFGESKLIFQTPMAALGSVVVGDLTDGPTPTRSRLKASNRKIEDSEFSVRFDANGNITSILSLEDHTEFIEQGKAANVFQIFEDKPLLWSAWDIDVYALETGQNLLKSESFEIVERGPVRVAAEVVKKFGASTIKQRISLGPTPGIRFDTEIDWHEEDKMLKVAFPVNVNSPRATYEIQFGNVERPTHNNTSWDVARFEMCAQKWVDLSEGDQGVALLNDCKYGHDIKGNVLRLTLLRSPKAPDPVADMGKHRFTYVLYPHFNNYQYSGVVSAAYALNAPVRCAMLEKSPGVEGQLPAFISSEDRNLVIETVKKAEDGNGIIVRLYESHNSRGKALLGCAREVKSAWLCDMEEKDLEEIELADGLVLVEYKPFEIITLRLCV